MKAIAYFGTAANIYIEASSLGSYVDASIATYIQAAV